MTFNPKKEMAEDKDVLGCLTPFYDTPLSVDNEEQIKTLHSIFCEHFIDGEVKYDNKIIRVKTFPYNKAAKDHLPEWYNGLNEKFVHIITRDVKANRTKTAGKIREFRSERALRIHWIKPIIENCNDKRIRRFKCLEVSSGREREYLWFNKGYMVVVEFINPNVALITGFCVDQENHAYYMRKYQDRIK